MVYVVAGFVLFATGIGAAHARRGLDLAYAGLAKANLSGIDLADSDLDPSGCQQLVRQM